MSSSALDWTVALDDMLCERWRACIVCGQPPKKGSFLEVDGLVLAVGQCLRCHTNDPDCLALCARLAARGRTSAMPF
jgi:hypothetical protein